MKKLPQSLALVWTLASAALPYTAYGQSLEESSEASGLGISLSELQRIQAYLEKRAPSASIVSTTMLGGEPVDCLDFYAQQGIRDLLARGERIDSIPSGPENAAVAKTKIRMNESAPALSVPCPTGSVPIHRLTLEEIASFGGLDGYLKKAPPAINAHEHSVISTGGSNWGVTSIMNLWNPAQVTSSNDFSLSQTWIYGGTWEAGTLETLEAGWIKRPGSNARLFIFFTPDEYGPGSCWNTDCGFVQTNSSIVLNGTFSSYSSAGGTQWENEFVIMKDGANGAWWFRLGSTWVGYWPRTLFDLSGLFNNGTWADFGGEVFDYTGSSHTTADMGGDGSFSSMGFGHAAYQRNIRYFEKNTFSLLDSYPGAGGVIAERPGCYDIYFGSGDPNWQNYIYFGGPGYNPTNCPL